SSNELARRVGVAKSAMSRYLNLNREFPLNKVNEFSKALDLSPEYILGFDNHHIETHNIPVVSKISAGEPIHAEENIESYIAIPNAKENTFGLIVSGDSMDKEFKDGDIVIVEKDAVYERYLEVDPTYKVKINATENAMKEEDKFLTEEQYLDLIEYFRKRSEKSYVLLFMLAITSARFSEVNNMTYNDLTHGLGTIHLPGTKTISSDRIIELNYDDIEHVKNWYHSQPKKLNRKLFEISNNAAMKSFKKALKDIGVEEKRRIYSLRHTHCSYLISKDIPIEYISKRL